MATSGSVNYSETATEIVTGALQVTGVLAEGETASASQMTNGLKVLNRMVKAWNAMGIHLWAYGEAVLFPALSTQSFSIGPTGDRCALESDVVQTYIATAALSGATTITVPSTTGIAASDKIGVVQDDSTIHWTTVSGAPTATVITLTAALTAAAAADNHVYTYTTILQRPLRITHARLRQDGDTDIIMRKMARREYFGLANKSSSGNPTQYYYDPQLTNGKFYLWPTFASLQQTIRFTFSRSIEDFDSIANDPDFPQEWLEALIYNLADRFGPVYGVPAERRRMITEDAARFLSGALEFDVEDSSVMLRPATDDGEEGWE